MLGQVTHQEQKLNYAKACSRQPVEMRYKIAEHQKPLLKETEYRKHAKSEKRRESSNKVC